MFPAKHEDVNGAQVVGKCPSVLVSKPGVLSGQQNTKRRKGVHGWLPEEQPIIGEVN